MRQRWGRSHPLRFVLERGSPSSHQKLQHRRVRAWHCWKRDRKRQRCQAFEIGHPQESHFSWATADENDKWNLEEHAHRGSRSFCFVRGEGSRQPLVWGGVHDLQGGDALHQVSCDRGAWQEARRLPRTNISHGAQVSRIREHYWIGETMSDDLVEALRSCRYMSVLMDGSTDSSVTEKEPFLRLRYGGMQTMKKLLINIETNFSWNDSVKKLLIKTEKVNYSLSLKSTPSDNWRVLEFAIKNSFQPAHQCRRHGYW